MKHHIQLFTVCKHIGMASKRDLNLCLVTPAYKIPDILNTLLLSKKALKKPDHQSEPLKNTISTPRLATIGHTTQGVITNNT